MFCQALFYLTFETFCGAGTGNRTRVSSLEGWCSTIELHPQMVGVTGIEPATSWSQTTRAPICATPRSVVYLKGFEPLTHGLEGRRSIQLS